MNVYDDPWLIDANRRILNARKTGPLREDSGRFSITGPSASGPAPEYADFTHGTMTAYKAGCRCEACWLRNLERCRRQRQARREREAAA